MRHIQIEVFDDLYDATYFVENMLESGAAVKAEIFKTEDNRYRVSIEW